MKIPTAEEFLEKAGKGKGYLMLDRKEFTDCMKKFAERHTQAALEAAKAHVEEVMEGSTFMSGDILNVYPKENIL